MNVNNNIYCGYCGEKIGEENAVIRNGKIYYICLNCLEKIILKNKIKGIAQVLYDRVYMRAISFVKTKDICFEFDKYQLTESLLKDKVINYDNIFDPYIYGIDHIIPMKKYKMYTEGIFQKEEFLKCFDLRNLRLITLKENSVKGCNFNIDLIKENKIEDLIPKDKNL